MPKKRICIAVIMLCLTGLYGARVYAVNKDVKLPVCQTFKRGEVVPYGKDFNTEADNNSEGYTVQVMGSEIVPAQEFCEKYDVKDIGIAAYYYMVRLCVENISNEYVGEQGAQLGIAMLVGTNYAIIPSPDMFKAVNPGMPGQSFSLQLGTKKEVWLVFQIIPGNAPDYRHLKKVPPMLQITQYAHQKRIQLSP